MTSSPTKPKNIPADFLKLPRELHHAILLETYDPNDPLDTNLFISILVKQPEHLHN